MTTATRLQIKQLLDQYLEYGDLQELAEKYLPKDQPYKRQYASKVKRLIIVNQSFLEKCIERAISNKSKQQYFTQSIHRLTA